MLIIWGLKNCDSCRAAIKWLEAEAMAYNYRDVRKDGLADSDVRTWLEAVGPDTLLNKRGTTWRQLPDDAKDTEDTDALTALIIKHPNIMKRPVFVRPDGAIIVEFRNKEKAAVKEWSSQHHLR